ERPPYAPTERDASGVARGRRIHPVSWVVEHVPDCAIDAPPVRIVKHDDATRTQHAVDVVELDHDLVERMPAVNESELNERSALHERRQQELRPRFMELHDRVVAGLRHIATADSPPLR